MPSRNPQMPLWRPEELPVTHRRCPECRSVYRVDKGCLWCATGGHARTQAARFANGWLVAQFPGKTRTMPRAMHPTAAPIAADLDAYVPPDPMLEIDRGTMALLGELADRRRENESAVVAAAVAAFHAATCDDPRPPTDPRGIAGRT